MEDDPDVPSLLDIIEENEDSFIPNHKIFDNKSNQQHTSSLTPPSISFGNQNNNNGYNSSFPTPSNPLNGPTYSSFQNILEKNPELAQKMKAGGIVNSFDSIISNPAIQSLYQNQENPSKEDIQSKIGGMSQSQIENILGNFHKIVKSGYLPSSIIPKGLTEALETYENIKSQQETSVSSIIDDSQIQDGDRINILELNEEEDPVLRKNNLLILAAKKGNFVEVKKLVENDADVNATDKDGNTALHWASYISSGTHLRVLKELINFGANVNEVNQDGNTPLHWACISSNIKAVVHLVQNGADLHMRDNDGNSCLHFTAQYNDFILSKYLIHLGANVNAIDSNRRTPIHWASLLGHDNTMRILLRNGAHVNAQDSEGKTPLHWAAYRGDEKTILILISFGADNIIVDKDGNTPEIIAAKEGKFSVADLVRSTSVYYANSSTPYQKKKQKILWFILGLLSFGTFAFFMVNFPTWFGISATVLLVYLVKTFFRDLFPSELDSNKFWVGMFVIGYSLSSFTYFTHIYNWHKTYHLVEYYAFFIVNCVGSSLYLYLSRSDPGICKPSAKNDWSFVVKQIESGEKIPDFCTTCMIAKPVRSKHCRQCNQCFAKFDHHCAWLDNCIGILNHKVFIIFLLLAYFGHYWFVSISFRYMLFLPYTPDSLWSIWNFFEFYNQCPLVFFMAIAHAVQILWETMTLSAVLRGITTNITYNEEQNGDRYKYMQSPSGYFYNPFKRGDMIENIKDWWDSPIDYFNTFFITKEALHIV